MGVAEDLADLRAYDGAKAGLASGEDELVPGDYDKRLIAGESPLRVWRELRGLSQVKLGAVSGVNRVQIADIEAGRGKGSVETVRKLAGALGVRVDDLV
jgi:mRNA interferase RelE/StbE